MLRCVVQGIKVWVPDKAEVWCQAVVTRWERESEDIPKLFLTLLDGTVSL